MKKLMICITLIFGLILQGFYSKAQNPDPSVIKSDPDWQTIANIEGNFIDKFVSAKINLKNFDLNNQALVLSTVGMSKAEYLRNVDLVRAAGTSLVKKYAFSSANCSTCKLDINAKNDLFRSVIEQFQTNPDIYTRFRIESLGLSSLSGQGTNYAQTCCCCGFWFYACCGLCSASIEAFPLYLACCGYCYHSECCTP